MKKLKLYKIILKAAKEVINEQIAKKKNLITEQVSSCQLPILKLCSILKYKIY